MEAIQQPDAEDGALNCLQDKWSFPASDLERSVGKREVVLATGGLLGDHLQQATQLRAAHQVAAHDKWPRRVG